MRIVFGSWKYMFKNIWFVLPFAILPAVFLTLCLDYTALTTVTRNFFAGEPVADFLLCFRALSIIRIDLLGGIYTVCAFILFAVFLTPMLSLIEKHMRLGKRTMSGAFSQFGYLLLTVFGMTTLYFVLYEVWTIVVSAVLFAISAVGNPVLVCLLDAAFFLLSLAALLYVMTVFYLWLPCKQMTGFGNYNAFLYSYRLMTGIRGRLLLSLIVSAAGTAVILTGVSFLPELVFRVVGLILFAFLFLNFGIRMETAYFAADKLDREDLIRSYREL